MLDTSRYYSSWGWQHFGQGSPLLPSPSLCAALLPLITGSHERTVPGMGTPCPLTAASCRGGQANIAGWRVNLRVNLTNRPRFLWHGHNALPLVVFAVRRNRRGFLVFKPAMLPGGSATLGPPSHHSCINWWVREDTKQLRRLPVSQVVSGVVFEATSNVQLCIPYIYLIWFDLILLLTDSSSQFARLK